jgi:prepilin-type N-terminal cleavage/methylation domain-containing protein
MKRNGFTLMEMLVVVAIIGVLMALLLPAINAGRGYAKRQRARAEVRQIETAWKAWLNDYRSFPVGNLGEDFDMEGDAIRILRGDMDPPNTRGLRYMDFDQNATSFPDPWGVPYRVVIDHDYDNQVVLGDFGGQVMDRNVAVYSFGQDQTANTTDDIKSWK